MGTITVVTPTIRPEGLALVEKALKRQTFEEFDWVIVSPSDPMVNMDRRWYRETPRSPGDVWTLNKAYNKAVRRAKGELIISWQDYTYAKPDTLERFWFHYQNEPKTLVTAVGNKYEDESWTVQAWKDPRERADLGTFYPCYFNDIEFNLCSIPKAALFAVGGFDEELDKFYGMDGYSVVDRLNMQGGWDFKIDQTIKSYSLNHGRPKDWEKRNAIHGPYEIRRQDYIANPVLSYLQSDHEQST